MRRIAMRLVVFLLLGAVVNVAVAWGCVLLLIGDAERGWIEIVSQDDPHLPSDLLMSRATAGSATYYVYTFKRPKPTTAGEWPAIASILPGWADRTDLDARRSHFFDAWGWPMLSMWTVTESPEEGEASATVHGGIALPPHLSPNPKGLAARRALPLRPIWPGFAINTLFYVAILWLLFAGPGRVRRWRRVRRGLCVKCAYPVGASDVCTECGAGLTLK